MANLFKHAVAGIKASNCQRNPKQTERKLKNEVVQLNGITDIRRKVWTRLKKPADEASAQKSIFNSAIMAAVKANSTTSELSNKTEQSNKIQEKNPEEKQQQNQEQEQSSSTLPSIEIEANKPAISNKQPKKMPARRRKSQSPASPPPKTKIKIKLENEEQQEQTQLPSPSPSLPQQCPVSSKPNSTNALNENNAKKVLRKNIIPPMEELPMHATPTKTPRKQVALDCSMCIAPFFTKAYAFSNHFRCYFDVDGRRYSCTEQFYMYYKAKVFGDKQSAFEIMRCEEARDMKRIGSSIRHFDIKKWRHVSILVMTIGNMAKYVQNKQLRKLLFETNNSVLVEASPDDIYWGVGISCDSAAIRYVRNWLGKNVLGRILTRIREVLKEKEEFRHEWKSIEESMRRQTI